MTKNISNSPWGINSDANYFAWREKKLAQARELQSAKMVEIADLAKPSQQEKAELLRRVEHTNIAFYQTNASTDSDTVRLELRGFADSLGLRIAEKHRSAGKNGIVAITPSKAKGQVGYIPYSKKPLNWHTDGYYNAPDEQIHSMVLHCFSPASSGGQSQIIDNEIAYIRLRDENPAYIEALMHEEAMSIPQNIDESGNIRPISIGPVFSIDANNNSLIMRYTARTRSIEWRKDKTTQEAVEFLQNLLENGDEFIQTTTLKAGQGILCNNSLHNRKAFDSEVNKQRLLFRVRFFNRIKESK